MNNQIKKYIVYNYDLVLFFHYFKRLVDNRCYKELKVDFQATQSRLSLEHLMKILQHTKMFILLLSLSCLVMNYGSLSIVNYISVDRRELWVHLKLFLLVNLVNLWLNMIHQHLQWHVVVKILNLLEFYVPMPYKFYLCKILKGYMIIIFLKDG